MPLSATFDYEQALSEGAADIVIGNWPNPPEHLHLSVLLEDEVVCMVAQDSVHIQPGKFTAQGYLAPRTSCQRPTRATSAVLSIRV